MSQTFRKLNLQIVLLANLGLNLSPAKSFSQNVDTHNPVHLQTKRERIDLPTAIKQLLSQNLDLKIERIEPKAADALVLQARGQFDPTFSAGANYLDSKKDLTTQEFLTYGGTLAEFNNLNGQPKLFDENILGFEATLEGKLPFGSSYALRETLQQIENTLIRESTVNLYNPETQFNISLEWTQPLLRDFGYDAGLATVRVLTKQRDAARCILLRATASALAELAFAYHDLHTLNRETSIRTEEVSLRQKVLDHRTLQQERGLGSDRQVQRARQDVLTARQALAEAEARSLRNHDSFANLIEADRDLSTPRKRYVVLPDGGIFLPTMDRMGSFRQALDLRQDYKQALSEAGAADVELAFAKDQFLPKLDLTATIGANGLNQSYAEAFNQTFHSGNEEILGNLRFSYPLFNRSARGLRDEKQKRVAQAILNVKRIEVLIAQEVDGAYTALEIHSRRFDVAKSLSKAISEELANDRVRVERGAAPPAMLIPRQIALGNARIKEWQVRADLAKTIYQLHLAKGTLVGYLGVNINQ